MTPPPRCGCRPRCSPGTSTCSTGVARPGSSGSAASGSRWCEARRPPRACPPPPPRGGPSGPSRLLLAGYAIAGETDAGLDLADEALEMGCGAELWEAEIRRLRAVFLAERGAPADEVGAELARAL